MHTSIRPLLLALIAVFSVDASAQILMGGRPVDPNKNFSLSASVGQVTEIKGTVTETTRQLYDILDMPEKQLTADSYDLNELGLSESDIMYGIGLEKMWRYVTLRGNFSYMTAEASGVARRDYFIAVDKISFQGQDYDHMKIEDGERYDARLEGALINLRAQITPFTIAPENIVSFTPFLHLGLFALVATFEADSGEATRIQRYQNPAFDFVVGGHGEGDFNAFVPEYGAGGEFRIYLGQTENGPVELALQGTYAIFDFSGSSASLGISSKNDKELDVNYDMIELRAIFNYPLSTEVDLLLGAEYRVITADGSAKAKYDGYEDAITSREKFDKDISIEMTMVSAFAGLRW
jgi:hypothetical protein